jgi:hypothetical protein
VAAYNITFGCNFLGTKTADIDGDGCWRHEGANNNKQKDEISWILYMRRCRSFHCNDLAVSAVQWICCKNEVP